ncbi:hypothetical protein NEPAR07_2016 [Nematocida parisii]|uniref:Uncharacterized protein n=1 Tax=Nematocida parisii (strain ERTm3) TaxID=935791 RepID=I3EDA5_NEMP3|nr:hypothetical protein NEQG_02537 [Nematocida parisii ERTm3]KAI5145990.1 hypothetical protein NEPAR07_2016 [Nematocida parisii]
MNSKVTNIKAWISMLKVKKCYSRKPSEKKHGILCKLFWAMQIILIGHAYAALTFEEQAAFMASNEIKDAGGNKLIINPQSTFNPMYITILKRIDVFYYMRFIWSGINLESYKKLTEDKSPHRMYLNVMIPEKDTTHSVVHGEGVLDSSYIKSHSEVFLKMFPSLDGGISIRTNKPGSFYMFLNNSLVFEYRYKILASLLLLAEGMEIPLMVKNNTELSLTSKYIDPQCFAINISQNNTQPTKNTSGVDGAVSTEYLDAFSVIDFFINNRSNNHLYKKEFSALNTYEQFKSGKIMKTPLVLIQLYIYEYIQSIKEMEDFAQTVHDMLYMYTQRNSDEHSSLKDSANSIFNKYFVSSNYRDEGMRYLKLASDVQNILIKKSDVFYSPQMQFHAMKASDIYNNEIAAGKNPKTSSTEESVCTVATLEENASMKEFTDYVETALLGLFCVLTYDHDKNMHTTEHMPNPSNDLKRFFSKYKYLFGSVSPTVHREWRKIVSGIAYDDVHYLRENKTQIHPDVINVFFVVAILAGCYEEYKAKIEKLKESIDGIQNSSNLNNVWNFKIKPMLLACIKDLIDKLSVNSNQNASICDATSFLNLNASQTSKKYDIFGNLVICINNNYIEKCIHLNIVKEALPPTQTENVSSASYTDIKDNRDPSHLYNNKRVLEAKNPNTSIYIQSIILGIDKNENALTDLKNEVRKENESAARNALLAYIDFALCKISSEYAIEEEIIKSISKIEKNDGYINLDKFVIGNSICPPTRSIISITRTLLFKACALELDKDHYIVRFSKNLLESVPTFDSSLQYDQLSLLLYFSKMCGYFPDITRLLNSIDVCVPAYCFSKQAHEIIKIALDENCPHIIYNIIKLSITNMGLKGTNQTETLYPFFYLMGVNYLNLIDCLTAKGEKDEYITSIISDIRRINTSKSGDIEASTLLIFINLACEKKYINIIKACINLADNKKIVGIDNDECVSLYSAKRTIAVLNKIKNDYTSATSTIDNATIGTTTKQGSEEDTFIKKLNSIIEIFNKEVDFDDSDGSSESMGAGRN